MIIMNKVAIIPKNTSIKDIENIKINENCFENMPEIQKLYILLKVIKIY